MRLLYLFLTIALLHAASPAPFNPRIRTVVAGGGGCDGTNRDAEATAVEDFVYVIGDTGFGSQFTAAGTYTICSAVLRIKNVDATAGNLTVAIYSNASGLPGTLVGTASANVAATSITASSQNVTFSGISASLTSGTIYHVVVLADAGVNGELGIEYADEAVIAISLFSGSWSANYQTTSRILFQLKS